MLTQLEKYILEKISDFPEDYDNVQMAKFIAELMTSSIGEVNENLEDVVDRVMIKVNL